MAKKNGAPAIEAGADYKVRLARFVEVAGRTLNPRFAVFMNGETLLTVPEDAIKSFEKV